MRSAVFLVFLVTLCGCHHHLAQVQSQPPQPVPVQAAKTPEPTPTPQVHAGGGGYCSFSGVTGPIRTPLMIAIWQGDLQKVKELTEANTDLNAKFPYCGSEGQITPLINAIEGKDDEPYRRRAGMTQSPNYEEVIEFLLHHGASPNVTVDGFSPLHAASEFGQLKTVQILLRYGANLETSYRGETPLLMAAHSPEGNTVIPELVAAGANINALNNLGGNAVSIAAGQHNLEGLKLFISLGVDGCAQDHDGRTALKWALTNQTEDPGGREIIVFLLDKCGRSGLVH